MLPPDVMAGAPIITIQGRNAVCVENHKRILEYTDKKIRVQTKIGPLSIEGSSLSISYYTKDELKITGYIQNVYYEQKKDKQS
ncbi:MAG: sporulation protein [Lachnospiraceae bacterium]|nr:sporulation protein [Lachnospiraceae bacterium]